MGNESFETVPPSHAQIIMPPYSIFPQAMADIAGFYSLVLQTCPRDANRSSAGACISGRDAGCALNEVRIEPALASFIVSAVPRLGVCCQLLLPRRTYPASRSADEPPTAPGCIPLPANTPCLWSHLQTISREFFSSPQKTIQRAQLVKPRVPLAASQYLGKRPD